MEKRKEKYLTAVEWVASKLCHSMCWEVIAEEMRAFFGCQLAMFIRKEKRN